MKRYAFTPTFKNAKSVAKNGKHFRIAEIDESARVAAITVHAEDETEAVQKFLAIPQPEPPPRPKIVTKRQLIDKLIAKNLASAFLHLIEQLPPEEKLLWDSSPTISSDFPFIKNPVTRALICSALAITSEELESFFA